MILIFEGQNNKYVRTYVPHTLPLHLSPDVGRRGVADIVVVTWRLDGRVLVENRPRLSKQP